MAPPRTLNFDRSSGQVFTEQTVRGRPRQQAAWAPRISRRGPQSDPGTSSLLETAQRETLRNIEYLTAESLTGVPWLLGQKLWQKILKLYLDSWEIWGVFANAYPDEPSLLHHNVSITTPERSILEYMQRLDSAKYVTSLTICDLDLARADVMSISTLKNLVTLEICGLPARASGRLVDDQVLRNWGRHARETGSFPRLRVLMLGNQEAVTRDSLSHLAPFPALSIFALSGFEQPPFAHDDDATTLPPGWAARRTTRFTRFTQAARPQGWISRLLADGDDDPVNAEMAGQSQEFEHAAQWFAPMASILQESRAFAPSSAATEDRRQTPQLRFKMGSSARFDMARQMYSATIFLVCRVVEAGPEAAAAPRVKRGLDRAAVVPRVVGTASARKRRKVKRSPLQGLWNEL